MWTHPVEDPWYSVTYNGTAIGEDISTMVTELTYTDVEHGESDTVELHLQGLDQRWKKAWKPDLAAKLHVEIGYEDGRRLVCGDFELDELEFADSGGAGDTVRIKALATLISPALRTKQSQGYNDTTLVGIVTAVAARNGLTARHDIDAAIKIDRSTQNHEADLPYLRRLAEDYGYAFAVRGTHLDFFSIAGLEAKAAVLTCDRTQLKAFCLKQQSKEAAKQGEVSYQCPTTKKKVLGTCTDKATTGDTQRHLKRVPSEGAARAQAKAKLHDKDKHQMDGTLAIVGEVRLVAGINVQLTGLFGLDGKWHVERTTHRLSRSGGYESEATIYRVAEATTATPQWSGHYDGAQPTDAGLSNLKVDAPTTDATSWSGHYDGAQKVP